MGTSSIQPELDSLEIKLSDEIANDRKQVDFLQKRISKNDTLLRAVRSARSSAVGHSDMASGSSIIREAVQHIAKPRFTQGDVEIEINKINPEFKIRPDRVRTVLWSVANKKNGGLLKVVTKGNNKQAAVYEKLENQANGHAAQSPETLTLTSEPTTMPERIAAILKGSPPLNARQITAKYETLNWSPAPNGNLYVSLLQCAYYMGKTGKLVKTGRGRYSLPTQ